MKYEHLIGSVIKIVALPDDPAEDKYINRVGVIQRVNTDLDGIERLWGSWGGIAIYPEHDSFEILATKEEM